jgi:transcription initiation factor TFIID subunit 9B
MAEPNGIISDVDLQPTQEASDPSSSQSQPDPRNPNLSSPSSDSGLSKRPRDARLLHMILANYGISAYAERVPLQLMDFAYRYTSSTLQDALHFTSESYGTAGAGGGGGTGRGAASHNDMSGVTLAALRLSIASRTHYQFNPSLPKEFYMELAAEKNRVMLPGISREWGARLPPEAHVLTGQGWAMKEEFDEVMVDGEDESEGDGEMKAEGMEDEGEGDEEEGGRMEDIFGTGESGDREMEDE